MVCETYNAEQYRIVRLEEGEDWMSEVKDNIRPGVGEGWIKVGAARCEKCWLEKLRMSRRLVEGNEGD